jgi:hypothetical protein
VKGKGKGGEGGMGWKGREGREEEGRRRREADGRAGIEGIRYPTFKTKVTPRTLLLSQIVMLCKQIRSLNPFRHLAPFLISISVQRHLNLSLGQATDNANFHLTCFKPGENKSTE